jgi:hypothetical protein
MITAVEAECCPRAIPGRLGDFQHLGAESLPKLWQQPLSVKYFKVEQALS